jgi:hypothetical protein
MYPQCAEQDAASSPGRLLVTRFRDLKRTICALSSQRLPTQDFVWHTADQLREPLIYTGENESVEYGGYPATLLLDEEMLPSVGDNVQVVVAGMHESHVGTVCAIDTDREGDNDQAHVRMPDGKIEILKYADVRRIATTSRVEMLYLEQGSILGRSLAGECSFTITSSDSEQMEKMFDLRLKVADLVRMHVGAVTLLSEGQVVKDTASFDAQLLPVVRLSAAMDARLAAVRQHQNTIQRCRHEKLQRLRSKLRTRALRLEEIMRSCLLKHEGRVSGYLAWWKLMTTDDMTTGRKSSNPELSAFQLELYRKLESLSWIEAVMAYQHLVSQGRHLLDTCSVRFCPRLDLDFIECRAILEEGFNDVARANDRFGEWSDKLRDLYSRVREIWHQALNEIHEAVVEERRSAYRSWLSCCNTLSGFSRRKQRVALETKVDREQKRLRDLRTAREKRSRKLDMKTQSVTCLVARRSKRMSVGISGGRSACGRFGGFVFLGDSLDRFDSLSL